MIGEKRCRPPMSIDSPLGRSKIEIDVATAARRLLVRFALVPMLLGICATGLDAADHESSGDREAVEAAGDGLADGGFPWYDQASDSARPIEFREELRREVRSRSSSGVGSSGAGVLTFVVWTVIAVVIVLIIFWIVYLVINWKKDDKDDDQLLDDDESGDRVEALPQEVRARRGNLLDEARHHYEAGDYDKAIVYLYSYQLLALDRAQWIRLLKGKTNRQYLRELGENKEISAILLQTMIDFENVYFGHHSLPRERFESLWRQVDRFQRLTARGTS